MDGINLMEVLITIALSILPIILFFKVWGMTNDIKELKNRTPQKDQIRDAEIAYLSGNPEIAQRILDRYLKMIIEDDKKASYFSEERAINRSRVLATYKYLDLIIPEDIDLTEKDYYH